VRTLALLLLTTPAYAEPLADAEVRLGYGMAMQSEKPKSPSEMSLETMPVAEKTMGTTPLTITAIASVRTSYEPPLAVYGGLVAELLGKTSAGAVAGIRLQSGRLRVSAGGVAIVAPSTLWGPSIAGGVCTNGAIRLCGDAQLTVFLGGADAHDDNGRWVITHAQLVGAVVIDAF
jgi:hypothetical protein